MSSSGINQSLFNGADMTQTDLSGVVSDTNVYAGSIMVGTDFTDSTLSWDDFSGVTFDGVVNTNTVVTAIVCDGIPGSGEGNSVRNFGLCLSEGEWVL